ncbi:beta-lactamase family protein [Glycomyces sp. A-F 0318]|uniref:serine hydrolase domain-containing protein n=1 Tax=Glycomyces amatae TaxID=2881355 RepID=UPI001E4DDE62|nr:serine hydrolase domain-containing protein [Glycomyces amatae]MCD0443391.1 beta-lactamase family protein [Glycomyces amatae]
MRRISIITAALLLTAACSGGEPDEAADTAEPACDPALTTGLSHWADAGFSGSLALGGAEGLSCLAAFGTADAEEPNTPETVFAIGSVSKAFTAAAVYDLVDAGALDLGDRAGSLVPELGGPAAEATVEQLLLHTSGLTGSHGEDHAPLDRDEAIAALSALETAFEPGTDYLYSNAGYTILALIVDEQARERSGSSYRDYLAEEILTAPGGERLGGFWDGEPAAPGPRAVGRTEAGPAASVGDFAGPHWAMSGNGDLAMTPADLATWTSLLFAGEIIAPGAVEELRGTAFDHGDGSTEIPGWVALDAEAFGTPVVMSAGGGGDTGHEAVVAWLPDTGAVLTVASNTDGVAAGELLEAIGPALAAGEPVPAPEGGAEADPEELRAAEGVYRLDSGGTFTVTAGDGALSVAADGADAAAALFSSGDYTAEDVAAHEDAVLSLLEGGTDLGDEERAAAEDTVGPITSVALAGTAVEESELRTYVRIEGEDGSVLAWYALDGQGGLAGVWLGAEPPVFTLVPTGGEGAYRQEDLSGAGAGLRVTFAGDLMSVDGPAGAAEARR